MARGVLVWPRPLARGGAAPRLAWSPGGEADHGGNAMRAGVCPRVWLVPLWQGGLQGHWQGGCSAWDLDGMGRQWQVPSIPQP